MKRLWKIALCLALALIALTACSGGEQSNSGSQIYAEATQYLGPVAVTETPTEAPQETAAPSDGGNNSGGVSILYYLRNYAVTLIVSAVCCTSFPKYVWDQIKEYSWIRTTLVGVLLFFCICYIVGSTNSPFLYLNF